MEMRFSILTERMLTRNLEHEVPITAPVQLRTASEFS